MRILIAIVVMVLMTIGLSTSAYSSEHETPTPEPTATEEPTPEPTATPIPLGSITIEKDTNPEDDDTSFDFDGTWDFNLEDDYDERFSNLPAGEYRIHENSTPDWKLADIECDSNNVDINDSKAEVIINLQVGENVTCKFTNNSTLPPPTPIPTVAPLDICSNIEGIQSQIPEGMEWDDFVCTFPAPPAPTGSITPPSTGSGGLK